MSKSRSQFDSLSRDDQKHILDLCDGQTYDDAVDQLRKPRAEGGLDIATSRAALCRFFTTSHQDSDLAVLAQYAAAANIRHEQHSNAFLGAIRANVEARVLDSLRKGKALADMEKDFRFLKTVENLYLADAQWRASSPKGSRANYQRHVDRCANVPDFDFIPVAELKDDPGGANLLFTLTEFDHDVSDAQERQFREIEARAQRYASLNGAAAPTTPSLPQAPDTLKTPVIPHIPLNSTNVFAARDQVQAVVPQKPKPYVSPTPKIGRNDPCPCGSGHKAKKCCHQ